jgi:hypothetical protein
MSEVGNSDAHIVEAIGKSCTRFAGAGSSDLRRAIRAGTTAAHASNYGSRELLAYAGFWLETIRPAASLKAGSD